MARDGVTIYDIAAHAGVSIATVSRVFNDSPRVSEKTRERIFEISRELGYEPNASARNLARRQTNLVSAVIPMMANYFYMEVLQGVQERIAASDFDLLVYAAPKLEDVDSLLSSALGRGKSAGVLLFSTPLNEDRLHLLNSRSQPVVLVDQFHDAFDSVSIDNLKGGYMATRHLLDCGYRNIGLIMAREESVPACQRAAGYRQALKEAGLPLRKDLVVEIQDCEFHGFTEEGGYQAMQALLQREPKPDAVFAVSDMQALGARRAIEDHGYAIPDDIALIGFDDIMISRYVGLTTLRQPMFDMGTIAMDLLLKRVETPAASVAHTIFSPELVARSSCCTII